MKNYGKTINKPSTLEFFPRLKNRVISRFQYRILGVFSNMKAGSTVKRVLSKVFRRLVGGYLYSLKLEINEQCNMNCRMCYVEKCGNELELK